jgi:hypothetical protein
MLVLLYACMCKRNHPQWLRSTLMQQKLIPTSSPHLQCGSVIETGRKAAPEKRNLCDERHSIRAADELRETLINE